MRRLVPFLLLALLLCGCEKGPSAEEKSAQCLKNLQSLWVPLEFYMTDHEGQYPSALEELTRTNSPSTGKPYIEKIPDCPPGWSYVYEVKPGTISHYTLLCRSLVVTPGLTPDYPRMTSDTKPVSQP